MNEIALARLNSFAPEQADVQPSEEPIFVLTSSQLQEILTRTIQPLQDEVGDLKDIVAHQREDIAALTTMQEQDISRISVDIAFDRQRLAKLEHLPGPANEERIERLRDYLKAKNDLGHKPEASFTEARAYLEVSRSQFSQIINRLDPREFVITNHPLNYKSKMIGLASRM